LTFCGLNDLVFIVASGPVDGGVPGLVTDQRSGTFGVFLETDVARLPFGAISSRSMVDLLMFNGHISRHMDVPGTSYLAMIVILFIGSFSYPKEDLVA
jgi:hypothetical protein